MADKLSFKISAENDSHKAFSAATKDAKTYKKEILDLMKKSKKTGDPFKKMGSSLKGFTKEFSKLNKSQDKFGKTFKKINSAGDDLADTLKSVNREDEVIASKLAQKGKGIQQSFKSSSGKPGQQSGQDAFQKPQGFGNAQVIKVDRLEAKNFSGKGMGVGGKDFSKGVSEKLSKQVDKNLSDGLGKIGAGVGLVAGGFIAAIGVAYSVMAAKANAFRASAQQQMGGLQQLGFGAKGGMPGQKSAGGFYSGHKGQGPGGTSVYMTGQQQVESMSAYAGQTGGSRNQIEQMMYGRQGGLNFGALNQAYGLNHRETAGTAGMLQRYGRGGESGMGGLIQAMGGAEKSGMGGARMKEFLDAMQDAVTQGVMSGSQRTNSSMIKGLETLMSTNDERLKSLAPEILRSSTQTMNQAAMLQGGPQGNFMFQAVMNQNKNKDVFGVMEQLASGDWLSNAQAALQEASKRSGGNKQWSAFNLTKGLGLNIASPKAQQELASMIGSGKASGGEQLTQKNFQQEVQRRLENTAQMIEETTKADYVESLHTLSEANRDAAAAVNSLREVITTIVDKGYELGKGAVSKTFGVNLGPVYPVEKGYE